MDKVQGSCSQYVAKNFPQGSDADLILSRAPTRGARERQVQGSILRSTWSRMAQLRRRAIRPCGKDLPNSSGTCSDLTPCVPLELGTGLHQAERRRKDRLGTRCRAHAARSIAGSGKSRNDILNTSAQPAYSPSSGSPRRMEAEPRTRRADAANLALQPVDEDGGYHAPELW